MTFPWAPNAAVGEREGGELALRSPPTMPSAKRAAAEPHPQIHPGKEGLLMGSESRTDPCPENLRKNMACKIDIFRSRDGWLKVKLQAGRVPPLDDLREPLWSV